MEIKEDIIRYESLIDELESLHNTLLSKVSRTQYNAFRVYSNRMSFVRPEDLKELLDYGEKAK